jgi:hypothetical protein
MAEEPQKSLDAPFLVSAGHGAGLGGVVVVAGQLEHAGVEADVIPEAFEHDTLQVVVQDRAGHPLELVKASTWPRRKLSSVWSRAKRA